MCIKLMKLNEKNVMNHTEKNPQGNQKTLINSKGLTKKIVIKPVLRQLILQLRDKWAKLKLLQY